MNVLLRAITVFQIICAFILTATLFAPQAQATCTVRSCNAIFARDPQLTQRITTLQQASLTSFSPSTLYVGYEISCDANERVTIPYCFDAATGGLTSGDRCVYGTTLDAAGGSFITSNGSTYYVGSVPSSELSEFTNSYADSQSRLYEIRFRLWSNSFLCSQESVLTPTYFTEACGITAPNPVRRAAGGYAVPITVDTTNLIPEKGYNVIFTSVNTADVLSRSASFTVDSQHSAVYRGFDDLQVDAGTYRTCVVSQESNDVIACSSEHCGLPVNLNASLPIDDPEFSDPNPDSGNPQSVAFSLCRQADPADRDKCLACYGSNAAQNDIADGLASDTAAPTALWTAFGCVQTSPTGMIQSFLRIILGLAGGIVLLVILYGAFLLTTSSGDPKRVQEGQEMVTSAIMGILFIIFSVIILQFIGVKLLQIPGFGT
ncbi:hypothetical protein KBD71_05165 [Candidatus Woesebacteria bacterium]|nr:hypothetical protein [Candidatus Woesebacteria bacterium]